MHVTAHLPTGPHTIEVGRIFCIGRNYVEHAKELGNDPVSELSDMVVFLKPRESLVMADQWVPLPGNRGELHFESELVMLLADTPASAAPLEHVLGYSLGFDMTLRDEQTRLRNKGLPWEKAKAFEKSALIGEFHPLPPAALNALTFEGIINDEVRQTGHVCEMIFSPERILTELSLLWDLKRGDLIYTGTPSGVGPVVEGDTLCIQNDSLGQYQWNIGPQDALRK